MMTDPIHVLCQAAQAGKVVEIQQLLEAGADIHEKVEGVTPLHSAAKNGRQAVVELLLDADSALDIRTEESGTALWLAVESEHESVVEFLLDEGTDVYIQKGFYEEDVLSLAAEKGNRSTMALLLEKAPTKQVSETSKGWLCLKSGGFSRTLRNR